MAAPQCDVALLLDAKPFLVPTAFDHYLTFEKRAELGVAQAHAFKFAVYHDVQQRLKRGTCGVDAAVRKIVQPYTPLRLDDGVYTGGKQFQALLLRPQHSLGTNRIRRFEKPAE